MDVEGVAGKLSEAMRSMIRTASPSGGEYRIYWYGRSRTFLALVDRGLARKGFGVGDYLTTDGLAVRDHLLKHPG